MFKKLKALYVAANKNKLVQAVAYGATGSAGTAYLAHAPVKAIGAAAAAGAVTAGLNYIRNPQAGNATPQGLVVTSTPSADTNADTSANSQ